MLRKPLFRSIYENVTEHSDKIAVEFGTDKRTYAELYFRSNRIYSMLKDMPGRNDRVSILVEKSPLLIESVLGVLKAEKVFIPIDVRMPENRIRIMMEEAGCNTIITEERFRDKLERMPFAAGSRLSVLCPDGENKISCKDTGFFEPDEGERGGKSDCYVYFTSGTTGTPKGVMGNADSVKHFIDWEVKTFGINKAFRVSQLISPSFDPFMRDVFVPLSTGGTLCIPENSDIIPDPANLITWFKKQKINLAHMVPTVFREMINGVHDETTLGDLRYIMMSGEPLRGFEIGKFYDRFGTGTTLVNLYGSIETTLAKSYYVIGQEDADRTIIPIGKPIDDTELLVLDPGMKKSDVGLIGEIYIRSQYMPRCYINDPAGSRKRFVKDPYSDDPKGFLYATGDQGRLLPDGNIECLGRIDHQVKIRGVRVELTEIETFLKKINFVDDAVVITKEDQNNEKYLFAFVKAKGAIDFREVRKILMGDLSENVVPARFRQLDAFPLLPNGKIDRRTLADLADSEDFSASYTPPETDYEIRLEKLISEILHISRFGLNDDFFLRGGDSLKAARLCSRVRKVFGAEMPIKWIFANPTLKAMASGIMGFEVSVIRKIPRAPEKKRYSVSSSQKRLYLIDRIESPGIAYNMPEALFIDGEIDLLKLKRAYVSVINVHDSLRTFFGDEDGEIYQSIADSVDFDVEYEDFSGSFHDDCEYDDTLADKLSADFIRPFDLRKAPLLRVKVFKLERGRYLLLRDMHHIISDGVTEEIMWNDVAAIYCGLGIAERSCRYVDYSEWQKEFKCPHKLKGQENFWMDNLAGELPTGVFLSDHKRPAVRSFSGSEVGFVLDGDLQKKIYKIVSRNSVTTYMVYLAAFSILLSRYSGTDDIIVGSPVAGRNHDDLDDLIGNFTNTLVMRSFPSRTKTFSEYLGELRLYVLAALDNQDYQFENIVDKLGLSGDLSRNPLFDISFMMQNMLTERSSLGQATVNLRRLKSRTSKFDMTFVVVENGDKTSLSIEFSTDIIERETAERFLFHYLNVLESIAENENRLLSSIEILSFEEKRRILNDYNATCSEYDINSTFPLMFAEQARKYPDKTAVSCGEIRLTYAELDMKSDILASCLVAKGIGRDSIVALLLPRSPDLFIGILGILKSGAAYLPLDPAYPEERIRYMISHSGAKIMLSSDNFTVQTAEKNPSDGNEFIRVLHINEALSLYGASGVLVPKCSPNDLAYVIYTSGSTGRPKGVMIEHRNIVNFIHGISGQITFSSEKKILCLTTVSFDIFVLETLVPFSKGMTVVLAREEEQLNISALCDLIADNGVDIVQMTPSRLQMFLQHEKALDSLKSVSELVVGGEAFRENILDDLLVLKNTRIFNVYGPTETTVWSTVKELKDRNDVNIGRPIANTLAYVLDVSGMLQPVDVPGELYLGGDGLARGYMNDPVTTKEKFVPFPNWGKDLENLFVRGSLYKTGDLAKFKQNGEIVYLGRTDNQVKVRGYRIELEEIEKRITEIPTVKEAACIVDDDNRNEKRIVAYYSADRELSQFEIREFLLQVLPDYMIPGIYVRLESFPLTQNLKINRKALPKPPSSAEKSGSKSSPVLLKGVQREIADLWQSLLDSGAVGADDNFFELGGNSLLVMKMHAVLDKKHPGRIKIADIFSHPTVSSLAEYISSLNNRDERQRISFVLFPDDYILSSSEVYESGAVKLSYDIPAETFAVSLSVEAENIRNMSMAVFVYLLSDLCESNKMEILKSQGKGNWEPVFLDFEKVEDMCDLAESLRLGTDGDSPEDAYEIRQADISMKSSGGNRVGVVFSGNENTDFTDFPFAHILMRQLCGKNHLKLVMCYESGKIVARKAEDFFSVYVKAVESALRNHVFNRNNTLVNNERKL